MRNVILFFSNQLSNYFSQELFVTDPASNVPANSLALNVMQFKRAKLKQVTITI
jgi:hypothetical protein